LDNFDFAFGLNFVGTGNFSYMKKNVEKFIKIDFMYYDMHYEMTGVGNEKALVRNFYPINYT
jgi:hypothetical protein